MSGWINYKGYDDVLRACCVVHRCRSLCWTSSAVFLSHLCCSFCPLGFFVFWLWLASHPSPCLPPPHHSRQLERVSWAIKSNLLHLPMESPRSPLCALSYSCKAQSVKTKITQLHAVGKSRGDKGPASDKISWLTYAQKFLQKRP